MDLLLYIDTDPLAEARYRVAVELVRVCGGHIECVQITSPVPLMSSEPFGSADILAGKAVLAQRHKDTLRAAMETRLGPSGISWSYRQLDGDPGRVLAEQVRLVDLVLLNAIRLPSVLNGSALSAGEAVSRLAVPVMAVPAGEGVFNAGGPALIAWDGSAQCGHAIRGSLELLKAAPTIYIVTIGREKTDAQAERAREYLAHHGLQAQVIALPDVGQPISAALLEAARTYQASYLVMGAYGHSRARELLLGGVTREVLANSPVPVVMAH
ncbi:MAG TPA: universal stress protein [Pedomonas sp.]|uniref:universal stress protein n=1 Tax=Pedomonas sp. TaxID=2976421 RepID=UPI002F3EFF43